MSSRAPGLRSVLALAVVVALGVALRFVPADRIFTVAYVNFQGDAWYHLRRLDWHLANFPGTLTADPYVENAAYLPLPPLFDLILAAFVAMAGWPYPASYTADAAAAVAPALLGGLVAIPVFLTARRLTSLAGAIMAALLAVTLPGPFLGRSIVGAADHHVAEVLFASLAVAGLMTALDTAGKGWWTALAGVSLGSYFLVWSGAAFIVPALIGGIALAAWIEVLRGRAHEALFLPPALAAGTALVLVALSQPPSLYRIELQFLSLGGLLGFCAAGAMAVRFARVKLTPGMAALALLAAGFLIAGAASTHPRVAPFLVETTRLFGGGAATVGETRPLLTLTEQPFDAVRGIFGWGFLGLLALPGLLLRLWRGREAPGPWLFIVWLVLSLLATLGQVRFGYYLVPNLAVLLGVLLAPLWDAGSRLRRGVAVLSILVLLVSSAPAFVVALTPADGAPIPWHQAMSWLRKSSPEPFGDPMAYFGRPGNARPQSTVLTWWDYGYWVQRIGRRVAFTNPTQHNAGPAGRLLTALPSEDNSALLRDSRVRTVVVSSEMLMHLTASPELFGKYATMLTWAGRDAAEYLLAAEETDGQGRQRLVWLFLPRYFESLAVHLYHYKGESAAAVAPSVFTVERGPGGRLRIKDSRSFPDQASAERYLGSLGPGQHLLASRDPSRTCVRLPARPGYRLAYESDDAATSAHGLASVRVFDYADPSLP